MIPPDFLTYLEGGGKHPPHCMVCAHAAGLERELVCLEYGSYVFLYSSCRSFESREQGLLIVKKEEISGRFASGILDLREQQG